MREMPGFSPNIFGRVFPNTLLAGFGKYDMSEAFVIMPTCIFIRLGRAKPQFNYKFEADKMYLGRY